MNKYIISLILSLSLAIFSGCDNFWYDEDITVEETPTTQPKPEKPVSVLMPDGKMITVATQETTPRSTEYEGEGIEYKRTIDHSRFLDITGVSPGEVASRVEAAKITTGAAPAINITPDGVDAKETKQATVFVGTSGKWSFLSTIWQRIKDFFKGGIMWIVIGVVVLFILPIFIPALAPIMSTIVGVIKTIFTWIIQMFVPIIAFIKGLFITKAATQLISSQELFKQKVKDSPEDKTYTKEEVINLLKSSNNEKQDVKVQNFVDIIKTKEQM